ncbi:MAG: PASTA domain-containing protein [Eggerthellaceae bacterium]|nr:PASTA domain-containing protein [Eggerthellaceae bacterium]
MYTVPNVISLTQSDAEKAILASGLRLGTVKREASETVPLGNVISQDPKGLTNAKANSKVNLVISSGKPEKKDVTVPDLKGKTRADAEKALSDVGLVGVASNPEESTEVNPGCVFKQSVAAGTKVKEGTNIAFTVAVAPSEAEVPNVVGKSRDDAKTDIEKAGFAFDDTVVHHDTVAEGMVISQSINAGEKARVGTTITVKVSLGPAPVEEVSVPNVMGFNWHDAEAAMQSAGLAVRYTGDPAGTVTAQDVAAGTKVAKNTLVTVTLTTVVETVTVPDLLGYSTSYAENTINSLGLIFDFSGDYDGIVVDQWPEAGEEVPVRTTVHVTSENVAPVIDWTPASSAQKAINGAGISGFSTLDGITIGQITYGKPSYSYSSGMVQALYESPATGLYIRKGEGTYYQPLTDRDLNFPATWQQNIKGLNVQCYGPSEGQATVVLWEVGGTAYGITYQGYGGEEMTLSADDVSSLINGIQ